MKTIFRTQFKWKKAAAEMLRRIPFADKCVYKEQISAVKNLLSQSQYGAAIMNWADKNNTDILMDPQADGHGSYTVGSNTVMLNPKRSTEQLAIVLCHELRHAWQDHKGLIPSQSMEDPKKYAAQIRFIEADAFAYSYVAAFDLFGHDELYKQKGFTTQTYAKTIQKAVDIDPYALKNGKAMFLAFNSFFNNVFLKSQYDASSLHKYATHMGAKTIADDLSNSGISTKSSFNQVQFASPHCSGIDLDNFSNTQKIGDLFGMQNYMMNAWPAMIKDPLYCGNFSADFDNTCAEIQNKNTQKNGTCPCP